MCFRWRLANVFVVAVLSLTINDSLYYQFYIQHVGEIKHIQNKFIDFFLFQNHLMNLNIKTYEWNDTRKPFQWGETFINNEIIINTDDASASEPAFINISCISNRWLEFEFWRWKCITSLVWSRSLSLSLTLRVYAHAISILH